MINWINIDEILLFHSKIMNDTGGSYGVRDLNLLGSSINKAFASFDNKEFYEKIESKVSTTVFSLIKNHCFIDGNKRIGIAVMLYLLKMNNIKTIYTQDELIQLGLGVAEGDTLENDILNWIIKHKRLS